MARPPSVVVFDVNETLSDLRPLAQRFEDVGASGQLLPTWFASVLRDGFALTTVDAFATFRDLALANLRTLLPRDALDGDVQAAADHVLAGFAQLDVHPDVPDGLRALNHAGVRLVTLTNGSVEVTEALLRRAELLDLVEHRLDVSMVGRWKPARDAYRHALAVAGVGAEDAALVAVHPWDIDGAQRAGLTGAWLNRAGTSWPPPFQSPHHEAANLPGLVTQLLAART